LVEKKPNESDDEISERHLKDLDEKSKHLANSKPDVSNPAEEQQEWLASKIPNDPLNKVSQDKDKDKDFDILKEIRDLRSEVDSLQKSVAFILRCLPYIIHDELVAHEYESDYNRRSFQS